MEKFGIELKWAGIITASHLLWYFIEKMLGWHQDFSYTIISWFGFYFLFFFLFLWAFIDKKNNFYNNNWSIKDGFKFGLFLTGLLAILNPMVQYIIFQSLSPDYFSNIITYKLEQSQTMTQEFLEGRFNIDAYVRSGIFDTLSFGLIYSIALAYLLKTKDYTPPVVVDKKRLKKRKK